MFARLSTHDKVFMIAAVLSAIGIMCTSYFGERPDLALLGIMLWSCFASGYILND
jgi:hypothetical protein